jgi:hypothetical protein
MSKRLSEHAATYGPQDFKNFPGALNAFFSHECPQLGGQRTGQVLVQSIVEMIERFCPPTAHLRPGQAPWVTVDEDEKGSAILCGRQHKIRYVAPRFMWRSERNVLFELLLL